MDDLAVIDEIQKMQQKNENRTVGLVLFIACVTDTDNQIVLLVSLKNEIQF